MKILTPLCLLVALSTSHFTHAMNFSEKCVDGLLTKHIFVGARISEGWEEKQLAALSSLKKAKNSLPLIPGSSEPGYGYQLSGDSYGLESAAARAANILGDSRNKSSSEFLIAPIVGDGINLFLDELFVVMNKEDFTQAPTDQEPPTVKHRHLETTVPRILINSIGGIVVGLAVGLVSARDGVIDGTVAEYAGYGLGGWVFGLLSMFASNVAGTQMVPALGSWANQVRASYENNETQSDTDFALWGVPLRDGAQIDLYYRPKTDEGPAVLYILYRKEN